MKKPPGSLKCSLKYSSATISRPKPVSFKFELLDRFRLLASSAITLFRAVTISPLLDLEDARFCFSRISLLFLNGDSSFRLTFDGSTSLIFGLDKNFSFSSAGASS